MKNATFTEATIATICEKVFEMLSKQRFFEWHDNGGRFDEYICDPDQNESGITKEDILDDIKDMLNL